MSGHCQQDGGFVGDAGCTHPNHQHSELVRRIADGASRPTRITPREAEAALRELLRQRPGRNPHRFWGEAARSHRRARREGRGGTEDVPPVRRQCRRKPGQADKNHRGLNGRTAYAKRFGDFSMLVISDKETNSVEEVFTIVPKRGGGR